MSDDPAVQARQTQMERFEEARRAASRPPGPARALTVLTGVGAALRRSTALQLPEKALDAALKVLSASEIEAWLEAAELLPSFERVLGAPQESAEALAAEGAESAEWMALALDGLVARDELASAWVGLDHFQEITRPLSRRALRSRAEVEGKIAELDQRVRAKVRWLVGINTARRAQRDLLDPAARPAAWWFSERSDCDDLPTILGGGSSPHLEACAACRGDLLASSDLRGGDAHLDEEDLWDLDLGTLPPLRRRAAEAHLTRCDPCRAAVRALQEGDRAIREIAHQADPQSAHEIDTVEVVGEAPHFRVLLQRRMRVLTVVGRRGAPRAVRVDTGSGLKAAALRSGEWVMELDPGEMGRLVELRVELEEGQEPEELHVKT